VAAAAALAALAALAVCVSVLEGTPDRLSGIALGSGVLLHAERSLALVAVAIAAVSVLVMRRAVGSRSSCRRRGCATKPRRPTARPPPWSSCRTSRTIWRRSSTRSPAASTTHHDALTL
jgi:hypothetical protein